MDLRKVYANFERKARHLQNVVNASKKSSDRADRDRAVAHVSLELETGIGYVTRSAFLAGMLGGKTKNGLTLPRRVGSINTALQTAALQVRKNKPKLIPGRDEPSWSSVDHLSKVVSGTSPSNALTLMAATSIHLKSRRGVKAARNFYAHRAENTFLEVQNVVGIEYGETVTNHPSLDFFVLPKAQPYCFLDLWIGNYVDIAEVLCGQ